MRKLIGWFISFSASLLILTFTYFLATENISWFAKKIMIMIFFWGLIALLIHDTFFKNKTN